MLDYIPKGAIINLLNIKKSMTDKTTFTNQTEIENEQEQLNEEIRMTEEDTGYDNITTGLSKEDIQYGNLVTSTIKSLYSKLYGFGLSREQVREKLQTMSRFFGNLGAVSDLSLEQMGAINALIEQLKLINYKF